MKSIRLASAILVPPIIYLVWICLDSWQLLIKGIFHPVIFELKTLILPWLVFAAPTITLLMRRGLHRYWHFVLGAVFAGPPIMFVSWWQSQAGERVPEMLLWCIIFGIAVSPFMGLFVWLLAVVGFKANNSLQQTAQKTRRC
jgi:hypothetical protein